MRTKVVSFTVDKKSGLLTKYGLRKVLGEYVISNTGLLKILYELRREGKINKSFYLPRKVQNTRSVVRRSGTTNNKNSVTVKIEIYLDNYRNRF